MMSSLDVEKSQKGWTHWDEPKPRLMRPAGRMNPRLWDTGRELAQIGLGFLDFFDPDRSYIQDFFLKAFVIKQY